MNLQRFQNFISWAKALPREFLVQLDSSLSQIFSRFQYLPLVVREFIDTTSASVVRYLPDGAQNTDKDYYYQKTDATANTVTITAFGSQLINGSATYVLSAQYDRCHLAWNSALQQWHIL